MVQKSILDRQKNIFEFKHFFARFPKSLGKNISIFLTFLNVGKTIWEKIFEYFFQFLERSVCKKAEYLYLPVMYALMYNGEVIG